MKRLFLALAVVLLSLTAAHAAPKQPALTLSGPQEAVPTLLQPITFSTTWSGFEGSPYPAFAVSCYQDLNGDNVINTSTYWNEDGVYGSLFFMDGGSKAANSGTQSTTFYLGGASSPWTVNGGGDAECVAQGYSYSWQGGQETVVKVGNRIEFHAEG
jgi:hypothetical protein